MLKVGESLYAEAIKISVTAWCHQLPFPLTLTLSCVPLKINVSLENMLRGYFWSLFESVCVRRGRWQITGNQCVHECVCVCVYTHARQSYTSNKHSPFKPFPAMFCLLCYERDCYVLLTFLQILFPYCLFCIYNECVFADSSVSDTPATSLVAQIDNQSVVVETT